jgi:hypothetical protein
MNCWILISVGTSTTLTAIRGFSKSLQANRGIVPQLCHRPFFRILSSPSTSYHSTRYSLRSWKPRKVIHKQEVNMLRIRYVRCRLCFVVYIYSCWFSIRKYLIILVELLILLRHIWVVQSSYLCPETGDFDGAFHDFPPFRKMLQ